MRAGRPRLAWRGGESLRQINRIGPFVELDRRTPGIRDERKRAAGVGRRVGAVHFDAGGFKLLDEPLQVLHIEADVVEHPALGGSAGVAVLANRICTPGMSATGAWLRRLGLAPNVFTYQAWLSGIAASGRKRWTCSCRIGTLCCLSSRISIFRPSGVVT